MSSSPEPIDHAFDHSIGAVHCGGTGLYAYVVKSDNTVQIRPLELGQTESDRVPGYIDCPLPPYDLGCFTVVYNLVLRSFRHYIDLCLRQSLSHQTAKSSASSAAQGSRNYASGAL